MKIKLFFCQGAASAIPCSKSNDEPVIPDSESIKTDTLILR